MKNVLALQKLAPRADGGHNPAARSHKSKKCGGASILSVALC